MNNVVILAPREEPVTPCDRMYLRIKRGVLRLKAEALAEELAKTEREIAIYSVSLGESSFTELDFRTIKQH